jgi:phenylalanyl-tRNA synthetase beta chain
MAGLEVEELTRWAKALAAWWWPRSSLPKSIPKPIACRCARSMRGRASAADRLRRAECARRHQGAAGQGRREPAQRHAIKAAKLRGVESFGMLCSAKELDIDADASGLLELPLDAPVGQPLADYLGLPDASFELKLTPNRPIAWPGRSGARRRRVVRQCGEGAMQQAAAQ